MNNNNRKKYTVQKSMPMQFKNLIALFIQLSNYVYI